MNETNTTTQGSDGVKKNDAQNEQTQRSPKQAIIGVLAAVMFIAGAMGVRAFMNRWTTFTSDESGFSISAPVSPDQTTQTPRVSGFSIPTTMYLFDNGDNAFTVSVARYPDDLDVMSDYRTTLEGALVGSAQNTRSTIDESDNTGEFLGHPAITGIMSGTLDGRDVTTRVVYFLVDNNLWMLMGMNTGESNFQRFVDSLEFNN
ncbi:hypothetical protein FWD07_00135 [Candidatus Saccharibacteria bacterium]|nr:hypothetical protein [Candidatus Saccharibacteria bacterium]